MELNVEKDFAKYSNLGNDRDTDNAEKEYEPIWIKGNNNLDLEASEKTTEKKLISGFENADDDQKTKMEGFGKVAKIKGTPMFEVDLNKQWKIGSKTLIGLGLMFLMMIFGLITGLLVMGIQNQKLVQDLKSQTQIATFSNALLHAQNVSQVQSENLVLQNQTLVEALNFQEQVAKDLKDYLHAQNMSQSQIENKTQINKYEMASKYLQKVINLNNNLVHEIVRNANIEELKLFLDIDRTIVNARDVALETPLHYAAQEGKDEIAKILLQNGAYVDAINEHRETPLNQASKHGSQKVVEILLNHGADAKAKNKYLNTSLHRAAANGHTEIAKSLLQNGAYVDAQDNFNDTPLHIAAYNGYPEVVEALLKHGARKDLKNDDNQTPLQVAEYYKTFYKRQQSYRSLEAKLIFADSF